jgi:hypothetical protein
MNSSVLLSRLPFVFTALVHILRPVLILGLSLFLFLVEALYLKTEKTFQKKCFHRAWLYGFLTFSLFLSVHRRLPWKYPQAGGQWKAFPSGLCPAVFAPLAGLSFCCFSPNSSDDPFYRLQLPGLQRQDEREGQA